MSLLWLYLFLHTVTAQISFKGYLGGSPVCAQWTCLNEKFNFTDVLPNKDEYRDFIRGHLPIEWRDTGDSAVEACYQIKETRNYTNLCTGQALLHCVVDKMIQNCPTKFLNESDRCARVASSPGNVYMFSQSRYENLLFYPVDGSDREIYLIDRQQIEKLNRYYISNCCRLPQLFDDAMIKECGFKEVFRLMDHILYRSYYDFDPTTTEKAVIGQGDNSHLSTSSQESTSDGDEDEENAGFVDPLECCGKIDDFIAPAWRAECGFRLRWDPKLRLSSPNNTADAPRNTTEQCEDLSRAMSCVLNKMGVLNRWGFIDHFLMKDKILVYTADRPSYLYAVLISAFQSVPLYGDHCDSPRKLLNLLDTMLLVCEPDKRQSTPQCDKMYRKFHDSLPDNAQEKIAELINSSVSYRVRSLPEKVFLDYPSFPETGSTKNKIIRLLRLRFQESPKSSVQDNRRYDFGVLGLLSPPPAVTTIDLTPKNKTLVLLPVYQSTPKNDNLALNSLHDDGVLRG